MFNSTSKRNGWLAFACGLILITEFQNCSVVSGVSFSALNGGVSSSSVAITPSSGSTPTTPVVLNATSYKPELVDRYYLDSLYTDVFGPTARAVNTTSSGTDGGNNGGLCSLYDQYLAYNTQVAGYRIVDPLSACGLSLVNYAAQTNANETVTRQALLIRSCSDLTANATTLAYALGKISAPPGLPAVTNANLLAAFHLFYRVHPDPDAALLQSLQVIFTDPANPTSDNWRDVIYTICTSSFWQVI